MFRVDPAEDSGVGRSRAVLGLRRRDHDRRRRFDRRGVRADARPAAAAAAPAQRARLPRRSRCLCARRRRPFLQRPFHPVLGQHRGSRTSRSAGAKTDARPHANAANRRRVRWCERVTRPSPASPAAPPPRSPVQPPAPPNVSRATPLARPAMFTPRIGSSVPPVASPTPPRSPSFAISPDACRRCRRFRRLAAFRPTGPALTPIRPGAAHAPPQVPPAMPPAARRQPLRRR